MRAFRRSLPFVALIGVLGLTTAVAGACPAWRTGTAIEVPGSPALNLGGDSRVNSISCAAAGYCAAGGFYSDGAGDYHAFVANDKNGSWGKAVEVPGLAALDLGGHAEVDTISCATARSCAAGGVYSDGSGHTQAFVVDQTNGVWGTAVEVPGLAALNLGGDAGLTSISCAHAGSCVAGGYYSDSALESQAFVVTEKNGVWKHAVEVPGSAALNLGGNARVGSISCATAGSCAAGGAYTDGSGHRFAFVANRTNGVWRKAIQLPGASNSAGVTTISCAAAGFCAAGGTYAGDGVNAWPFVANERDGVWRKAIRVPGLAALGVDGYAEVLSIACAEAGSCAAGGRYKDANGDIQAFVVTERNGVWGKAEQVPGSATLNAGGVAAVDSISCATARYCVAGGYYKGAAGGYQAFLVTEKNGVWGTAIRARGTTALNAGDNAQVTSVSCPAGGLYCAVGGSFASKNGAVHMFVTAP